MEYHLPVIDILLNCPGKEDHDNLPDNYVNSQARMKGQLRQRKREPKLLKEYDRIIKEQAE